MTSSSYSSCAGWTHLPLSASKNDNAYASRSPFASPALHYDGDSRPKGENVFVETYGACTDAASTPAPTVEISPSPFSSSFQAGERRSRSSSTQEKDQHFSAGTSQSSPPAQAILSHLKSGARASLPRTVERITRWLHAFMPNAPLPQSTTVAASDKPRASSVEGERVSVDKEDVTTPIGAGSRSSDNGGAKWSTIKSRMTMQQPHTWVASQDITTSSSAATLESQWRHTMEIHEPFHEYTETVLWKPQLCKRAPSSPSSLAAAAHPPMCVVNHNRTGAASSTSPHRQAAERMHRRRALFLFRTPPRSGEFVPLIEWLMHRGERGDVDVPAASQEEEGEYTQVSFFSEDYIMKLCAAATEVLVKEPTLLELEVLAHDTLVVVGDIHGQFQDFYTSVLCQQYDRRRCNTDGRDRRFLFMGDYVDRGPNSLEVVLLLLALKVEYPTLVYLTRGNHEEEKASRVYGFLTEVTASLGAAAGAAVWTAVNRVFLDLPLAAVVQTLHMRFFAAHGGLSPGLEKVDEICALKRRNYSCGNITADEDDMITGLLWSDPTSEVDMYKRNPRGCGFLFGPAASEAFCTSNNFDFICRAHQVAMDGYFWTHNDRVVTVFSAPNYCGVSGNKGALLLIKGRAGRPIIEQFDCVGRSEETPARKADFAHAEMFT